MVVPRPSLQFYHWPQPNFLDYFPTPLHPHAHFANFRAISLSTAKIPTPLKFATTSSTFSDYPKHLPIEDEILIHYLKHLQPIHTPPPSIPPPPPQKSPSLLPSGHIKALNATFRQILSTTTTFDRHPRSISRLYCQHLFKPPPPRACYHSRLTAFPRRMNFFHSNWIRVCWVIQIRPANLIRFKF